MRKGRLLIAALGVGALVLAACGSDEDSGTAASSDTTIATETSAADTAGPDTSAASDTSATTTSSALPVETDGGTGASGVPEGPTIVIGAQDFGESAVLAQLYGQALEAAGYPVEQQALGGYRDLVYTAFDSGDINFTLEYAASALEYLNNQAGEATSDIDETAGLLRDQLTAKGLTALEASDAVDSNSFVVTPETADAGGLSKISDLTADMVLGGPPDCPENASCLPGLKDVYGLDLSANFVPLDGGGPLTVAALEGGEIDVAILFSSDGIIADKGWVVLEDDKGLINADNVIPVLSDEVAQAYGDDFTKLVNSVSGDLDTEGLTELNRQFTIDKRDAEDVAHDWLVDHGYLDS